MMSPKEYKETLSHVLLTIFGLDDATPLVKILELERWNILSFVTDPYSVIASLSTNDAFIPSWQLVYIDMFSQYFYYRQDHGEPLHNNWTSLRKQDFETWIHKYFPSFEKPQMHLPSNLHMQPSFAPPNMNISSNTAEQQAALIHILSILYHDSDSPLTLCLQQYPCLNVEDLATLPTHEINTMTYTPSTKTQDEFSLTPIMIDLPKGFKNDIHSFQGYVTYRNDIGEPLDDWLSITQQDIDQYRVSNNCQCYIATLSNPHKPTYPPNII